MEMLKGLLCRMWALQILVIGSKVRAIGERQPSLERSQKKIIFNWITCNWTTHSTISSEKNHLRSSLFFSIGNRNWFVLFFREMCQSYLIERIFLSSNQSYDYGDQQNVKLDRLISLTHPLHFEEIILWEPKFTVWNSRVKKSKSYYTEARRSSFM